MGPLIFTGDVTHDGSSDIKSTETLKEIWNQTDREILHHAVQVCFRFQEYL